MKEGKLYDSLPMSVEAYFREPLSDLLAKTGP